MNVLTYEEIHKLYQSIVNYYSSKVKNFGDNLYGYNKESNHYNIDLIGIDGMRVT